MNFWAELKKLNRPTYALAPMDGVTDFVHREIVATTAKPDVFYTEFTNVEGLNSRGFESTVRRLKFSENQRYIVAQLWGKNPENFNKAAKLVKDMGFDGIDLNMGCPETRVMKMKLGAALIGNNGLAQELIEAIKEGGRGLAISVKTRIGIDTIVTESWIEFLLSQGLDELTIHGRTAREMSKVPVHWDQIELAVQIKNKISPATVILGNGDVKYCADAENLCGVHGIDGVMIGKGIFSNPWVFEKKPKIHSEQEYIDLLLRHTKLYGETYPDKRQFGPMKKFILNYLKNVKNAQNLKEKIIHTSNYNEVHDTINLFYKS
ncbi:tRNA-dihydrouridine synthase [candidate division WWE3 bacterium]|uniref:tRNA-dihydrouridine synthase n=1 Tax=candidate division WWE3 bacterium TaxID=2053526 RepID=A0A7X9HGN4_UNCKA|nr:tRNA-dihydrouridine synthase [candidate division WWE3 bacterium]